MNKEQKKLVAAIAWLLIVLVILVMTLGVVAGIVTLASISKQMSLLIVAALVIPVAAHSLI